MADGKFQFIRTAAVSIVRFHSGDDLITSGIRRRFLDLLPATRTPSYGFLISSAFVGMESVLTCFTVTSQETDYPPDVALMVVVPGLTAVTSAFSI